jgi:hypothetical protein
MTSSSSSTPLPAPPTTTSSLQLLFPSTLPQQDISRWFEQPIELSPDGILKQIKGGPCSVLAALQANLIAYTHFRKTLLVDALPLAMIDMLQQTSPHQPATTITIATSVITNPTTKLTFQSAPQLITYETINITNPPTTAIKRLQEILSTQYCREGGVMLFVLSLIQSRGGTQAVKSDMDDIGSNLVGSFGHSAQELVNLCLIGRALSQVHDGILTMENGLQLRGLEFQPRIGFLTKLEALRYVKVGSLYKNPILPIWVIGSESHFTVIHCDRIEDDQKSATQEIHDRARRIFSSKDSHDNGFVMRSDIVSILTMLGCTGNVQALSELISPESEIVLWNDFWRTYGGRLVAGDMDYSTPPPPPTSASAANNNASGMWACATCTYYNNTNTNQSGRCEMCDTPRPNNQQQQQQQQTTNNNNNSNNNNNIYPAVGPVGEVGGRILTMYHIDGLKRTVQGVVSETRRIKFTLTTCDEALEEMTASNAIGGGNGIPFEETLNTKWRGAVFEYGVGGSAPSIVG